VAPLNGARPVSGERPRNGRSDLALPISSPLSFAHAEPYGPCNLDNLTLPVKPHPAHFLLNPLKPLAKNFRQICRLFPRSAHNRSMVESTQSVRRAVFPAGNCTQGMGGMGGMHTVWTRYGKGMSPSLNSFAIKYRGMPYRGGGGGCDEKAVQTEQNLPAAKSTGPTFSPLFPPHHGPIIPERVLSEVEGSLPF